MKRISRMGRVNKYSRDEKLSFARSMRNRPREVDIVLWQRLRRNSILGLRFRRQHLVAGRVLDFYCPELNLAVEINNSRSPYNRFRSESIVRAGITLLEFSETDVLVTADEVVQAITDAAKSLM
jgi:very-short-patch-repair endonuclease